MVRFKQFTHTNTVALQVEINAWLARAQPAVQTMQQSVGAGGLIVVGFLYEEGFQTTEQRLSEEAVAQAEHVLLAVQE